MITFKSRNIDRQTRLWEFESIEQIKEIWNSDDPDLPANDDPIWDVDVHGRGFMGKRFMGLIEMEIITDIEWETDEEDVDELPSDICISGDIDEDEIANALSDEFGFLVKSFRIMEISCWKP